MEMSAMPELKSVTCDPSCGFMIRSHDEKEIIDDVKRHVKNTHHMKTTKKEIKKMIKSAKV
jgi:predicted small metal-binding protein